MLKFEYMIENITILHDTNLEPMVNRLNELGEQGWEAILIKEARAIVGPDGRHVIGIPTLLKRIKEHSTPIFDKFDGVEVVPNDCPTPVKRGPGRPRKYPITETNQENTSAEIEPANLAPVEG